MPLGTSGPDFGSLGTPILEVRAPIPKGSHLQLPGILKLPIARVRADSTFSESTTELAASVASLVLISFQVS